MIDWLARANSVFSQTRPNPTDRTDETPISSVSSAPLRLVSENSEVVSSVSSVGVAGLSQKRMLTLVINRCCDARGDDAANRRALVDECGALSRHEQDDLIEHFSEEAIRWERANGTDETDETTA